MFKKFIFAILITIITATATYQFAVADTTLAEASSYVSKVDEKIADTINYLLKVNDVSSEQELLDNVFAASPDMGGEWVTIALRQYMGGIIDYAKYKAALENLATTKSSSVGTTRERYSLTLQAVGSNSDYINQTLTDAPDSVGIMSYVFGLHLLSNGATSDKWNAENLIDNILSLQKSDGGWSVIGDISDVDVTAMTIQALALYKDEPRVAAAIETGLKFLKSRQLSDGNFGTEGATSSESNAQVLVCLSSLGIDAASDERFIKNGNSVLDAIASYEIGDGSYSHTLGGAQDMTATKQALYALVSYTLLEGGETLYHFTSNINTPKHESVANNSSVTGVSSAGNGKLIAYIIIAVAFVIACVVLFVMGKRSIKSYIAPLAIAIIAVLITSFINFSSADNYYGKSDAVSGAPISTTISISCDTIKDSGEAYVPVDGIILPKTTVTVTEGASVYDQLVSACKSHTIQMESEGGAGDAYIAGLAYIYEYDFGNLSGWMYKVNGTFADVGCGSMKLQDGDNVEWVYTTDLGKDVGDNSMK